MAAFKHQSVDTLEALKQIQDSLMADNLPADDKEITDIENRMIKTIQTIGITDKITQSDLDALTVDNYHTIRRAAEKAMQIF